MASDLKQEALAYLDEISGKVIDLSHQIWDFAELSLKEYRSAELYKKLLREEGFTVEENVAGIATAFTATYSKGDFPCIGILAEFDALSGLSQEAGATEHKERVPNGSGHGCGHNMLGAAAFGAACAVKRFLERSLAGGTVILYGCPGEEGGAAKAFMARDGVFNKLSCALTWHPGDTFEVTTGTNNACTQVLYKFHGVASHAAGAPEKGRSALDAVSLMNVGVQFLREHMPSEGRIHYAIVDGGGLSPNVVQPHASVLYMVRSTRVKDTLELQRRVDLIAQGAALMTETTYDRIFVDGTSDVLPNTALEDVFYDNFLQNPLPTYTEAEWDYAKALKATFPGEPTVPGYGYGKDPDYTEKAVKLSENGTRAINDFLLPPFTSNDFTPGSTDVGDVSWIVPTAQFHTATWPSGSPGHSWQNVACGVTSMADKGMMYAAKILAGAAIDLYLDNKKLGKAILEFQQRTKDGGYVCPIPPDAVPYVIEE